MKKLFNSALLLATLLLVNFSVTAGDKRDAEKLVHKRFKAYHEWCKAELSEIIAFIESI